jgi:hypothetical protein
MRKAHIIALGLALLSTLVIAQLAAACFDVDMPPAPTSPWKGSASGFGKAQTSSTALHPK